jgi:hypothetical protein
MPFMLWPMRLAALASLGVALVAACGSNGSQAGHGPEGTDAASADGETSGDASAGPDGSDGSEGGAIVDSGGSTDAPHVDSGKPAGDGGPGANPTCKRGIASNTTPSTVLSPGGSNPGVTWWYDWSNNATSAPPATVEFVPMIWGSGALAGPIPAGSKYLLGFNEPNFSAQSNLTPQQAATDWPKVEMLAKAQGIPIVSPAVNFCGSSTDTSGCSDPSITDPYTWLKDFFMDCTGCEVDAVAVHWYNCDLPSLQGYIEGNNSGLEGFVQFGKPIWLTEFSCSGSSTVADNVTYMQAAVPWLESNAHVARYSWFSSSNIANALLENPDGSLTMLGQTYVGLAQTCP